MVDNARATNLVTPPPSEVEPDYEVNLVSLNQWQIAWRRFLHHKLAVFGSILFFGSCWARSSCRSSHRSIST